MIETVLVLPSPRALLPPISRVDPVATLRVACEEAVAKLPPDLRVIVLAAAVSPANRARGVTVPLGHRVAAHLLGDRPHDARVAGTGAGAALRGTTEPTALVVVADGSARRGEKAPGHVHPGAEAFDDRVEAALRAGDAATLAGLDPRLAAELWCEGIPGLRAMGEVARGRAVSPRVDHAEAPYGVAWWVARWDLT